MSATRDKKFHMIGNAHIAPVWLWTWQEGFQEVKATFRSALDRMNEYPDFCFTDSSAAFYEWVEENEPAMFQEIRRRVAEGRWQLVGGWWIQPDCNIPSGESFVRQGLYAQRYFKEKFGVTANIGFNPDSFGHNATLPQILKKSGMDYYIFMRPEPPEKYIPAPVFWWQADDGSRVLAFRILYTYCTSATDLERHVRRCIDHVQDPLNSLMVFYGVGNHGGGPTRENLESVHRLNQNTDIPTLMLSRPSQFFAEVMSNQLNLPVVHDELQHHARGCYAAHSGVKRWNRQAEQLLLAAEKFSSVAHRSMGLPYPQDLTRAWKNVLFNQFHDILAGTSIEAAYEDTRSDFGEAMAVGGRALNHAIQTLAWNINIPLDREARPIVVFNPHTWQVRGKVEVEFARIDDGDLLVDENDRRVPFQKIQAMATTHGRTRICFLADLPALGYRTYHLVTGERAAWASLEDSPENATELKSTDTVLENAYLRLELDPRTGFIASLYDKREDREVFGAAAARPVVVDDPSDTWGHDVVRFNREIGMFKAKRVRRVEHGPVRAILRAESDCGGSRMVQDFIMYRELAQIDVHVMVDWREQRQLLKLRFPVNLHADSATFEIPYGHIERVTDGAEEPGQNWVDVSDEQYGLAVLNDSKYSFDVDGSDIGLTVLRSPIYAHHTPAVPAEDADYAFMDQGVQHLNYTLLPHYGSWKPAWAIQRAAEINFRPIALLETYHPDGKLPQRDSFIEVDPPTVVVSVLKRAEDNDDFIVRAYEAHHYPADAIIRLPRWNRVITAHFHPAEIKTFRIPVDETQPIVETNLIEW